MARAAWVRRLTGKIWSNKTADNNLFLDEKGFRFELAREKLRVHRNSSTLAVLTFDLPADCATPRDVAFLGRLLMSRLRITDTIGLLSDRRVGVLLPDTSKSGAWKVASDICNIYPVGHDRPSCEVYVYPDDDSVWNDGAKQREKEPVAAIISTSMQELLIQRTPISKRALDVLGALAGLIISAPLLLLIAAAIKLSSRGPVMFTQEREGLGGRRFVIYKLRTMRVDADNCQSELLKFSEQDGPAFKMRHDPRVIWIGRWLRWTSLDELPQLWNVLRGDMSLVGPRPLRTRESVQCLPWQRERLSVVPGLTCIWQVRGRNTVSFDQWMRMDMQYVFCRSFFRDLILLLATPPAIVFSRGPR